MSINTFSKRALSLDQQVDLLKTRGLSILDQKVVKQCLGSVSFHRLSTYFAPYELNHDDHQFKSNITFQHIWGLYVFDRELRLLVLDVIERIEIALRTALTNHMAVKYGAFWYTDDQLFKSGWARHKPNRKVSPKEIFFSELNRVCNDKKHNETIRHYYQNYQSPSYPPSWVILECLSFGKCTSLFRYLRSHKDKAGVSEIFGIHHKVFESSLEPLRYIRNLCAHHSRLWDRWFVYKPRQLQELSKLGCKPGTLKEQLGLLSLFLKHLSPNSSWKEHVYDLFARFEAVVPFELMGFDENWSDDPFWKV